MVFATANTVKKCWLISARINLFPTQKKVSAGFDFLWASISAVSVCLGGDEKGIIRGALFEAPNHLHTICRQRPALLYKCEMLQGLGRYHETYRRGHGFWKIASIKLTRLRLLQNGEEQSL